MTPTSLLLAAADVIVCGLLVFAVYYPRHRRRDLVVAFLGVNVGVLAVTLVLGGAGIAAGLGLGLFGVLSIIRLRSSEISQREVAYYFAALAMGLLGGLPVTDATLSLALLMLILVVMWVADHPGLLSRTRQQLVRLDRAVTDEDELRLLLAERLGAEILRTEVQQLDFVNDSALVDVRYRVPRRCQLHELAAGKDQQRGVQGQEEQQPASTPDAGIPLSAAHSVPAGSGGQWIANR